MNTAERAAALAAAARPFQDLLGPIAPDDLLALVRLELGHEEILDGFRAYDGHLCRAFAPETLVHIISGNTPHAALQSLVRGILLGSHNRVKLPSTGLPEAGAFRSDLPAPLADRVELLSSLPDAWLSSADAVVVYGGDDTIAKIRSRVPIGVPFQAHGHRVSLGIVFDDPDGASLSAAARDISLFDQHGCLSPHDIYVDESSGLSARSYAAQLAAAMEAFDRASPRRPLSVGEAAAIADLRASYAFRSAGDVRTQIWQSEGTTNWTVIYEDDPWFATSPLNRFVFVKPLPSDLDATLVPVSHWLGAIGIWPASAPNAEHVAPLGASRICALGRMQFPPLSWHAEGMPNLANLVRWVDFEPNPA